MDWRRPISFYRVSTRALFLGVVLLLALVFWNLQSLQRWDLLRPQIAELLKYTFHCQVEMGHIRGELLPYPSLVITRLALIDPQSHEVLASVGSARLSFSAREILKGHIKTVTLRFVRPRFIVHRQPDQGEQNHFNSLILLQPAAPTSTAVVNGPSVSHVEIRNGSFEFWDHTQSPTSKWVFDQLDGVYDQDDRTVAVVGRAISLGKNSRIDLHYRGADALPVTARFDNIDLDAVQKRLHLQLSNLSGHTGLRIRARFVPKLTIRATITNLMLDRFEGTWVSGSFFWENRAWRTFLTAGTRLPMTITARGSTTARGWTAQAMVNRYNARLVRALFDRPWLNRLLGPGSLQIHAQSTTEGSWSANADGSDFDLADSVFHIPAISVKANAHALSVKVHNTSAGGGLADVIWENPDLFESRSTLLVSASSVTVGQVLQVFYLESKTKSEKGRWNPHGYEPWLINQGNLQATLSSGTLHIDESRLTINGMSVELKGDFGLRGENAKAVVQGTLQQIPVQPVLESFFAPPAPITGTGQLNFALNFPLTPDWLRGLNGSLQVKIVHGVVQELKTFYRISSVLNLTNYFRLRLPQVTAQGIVFQTVVGTLAAQNGVLSTQDLFLRSPNMNVGVKGSINLPNQSLDLTVRLELLRFIDDILKVVPITHWLIKPNKILFPLLVVVKGPWDHVEVR